MTLTAIQRWIDVASRASRNERADVALIARQVFNELKLDTGMRWLFTHVADRHNIVNMRSESPNTTIEVATCFAVLAEVAPEVPPSRILHAVDALQQLSGTSSGVPCGYLGLTALAHIAGKCGSAAEFTTIFEKQILQLLTSGNATFSSAPPASTDLKVSPWDASAGTRGFGVATAGDAPALLPLHRWADEQLECVVAAAMPFDGWCTGSGGAPSTLQADVLCARAAAETTLAAAIDELTVSPQRPTSSHDVVAIDDADASPVRVGSLFGGGGNASVQGRRVSALTLPGVSMTQSSTMSIASPSSSSGAVATRSVEPYDEVVAILIAILFGVWPPRSHRLIERALSTNSNWAHGAELVPERRRAQLVIMSRVAALLDMGLDSRGSTTIGGVPSSTNADKLLDLSARVRSFLMTIPDINNVSGSSTKNTTAAAATGSLLPQPINTNTASARSKRSSTIGPATPGAASFLSTLSGGLDSERHDRSARSDASQISDADTVPASPTRTRVGADDSPAASAAHGGALGGSSSRYRHDSIDSLETSSSVDIRGTSATGGAASGGAAPSTSGGVANSSLSQRSPHIGATSASVDDDDDGDYSDADAGPTVSDAGGSRRPRRRNTLGPSTSRASANAQNDRRDSSITEASTDGEAGRTIAASAEDTSSATAAESGGALHKQGKKYVIADDGAEGDRETPGSDTANSPRLRERAQTGAYKDVDANRKSTNSTKVKAKESDGCCAAM